MIESRKKELRELAARPFTSNRQLLGNALSEALDEIERLKGCEYRRVAIGGAYADGYSQGFIDAHQIKQNRAYTMRDQYISRLSELEESTNA